MNPKRTSDIKVLYTVFFVVEDFSCSHPSLYFYFTVQLKHGCDVTLYRKTLLFVTILMCTFTVVLSLWRGDPAIKLWCMGENCACWGLRFAVTCLSFYRINYDVACPMNFRKYPYDVQMCKVKYESCK